MKKNILLVLSLTGFLMTGVFMSKTPELTNLFVNAFIVFAGLVSTSVILHVRENNKTEKIEKIF